MKAPYWFASCRARLFLVATFLITWGAWWTLAWLTQRGVMQYGEPLFMTLYMLGGFGPTIAAYLAVMATRSEGSVAEYHTRLFHWRVNPAWFLVALGLPFALGFVAINLGGRIDPRVLLEFSLRPWSEAVPMFSVMIVGGGLEELGWRGVAQPELERRMRRPFAALVVGLVWGLWHLPLFHIPGVVQYQTNFVIFSIGTVGLALILAWLYGRTRSILLCIMLHAANNTAMGMGLAISPAFVGANWASAALTMAAGIGLLLADMRLVRK